MSTVIVLGGDGFQGEPRLSLKPLNPNLCCAQQLVRRSFGRQRSYYRWIESFHDQPNPQDNFLHGDGSRQGNIAGNTVTAEQGQHASYHQQDDRDDPEAREPSGNEP